MFRTKLSREVVGLTLVALTVSVCGLSIAAEKKPLVVSKQPQKLPPECEKAIVEAHQRALAFLSKAEQLCRTELRNARSKQRLETFVREVLGIVEKLKMGRDLANGQSGNSERIRLMFRQQILNDEEFAKSAADFIEEYKRFLAEEDNALLIKLKIDRDIPVAQLSRGQLDDSRFRQRIGAVINDAISETQTDVLRFAANLVVSEVLASGVTEVARGSGLFGEEENQTAMGIFRVLAELAIGKAIETVTDPTDKVVERLESKLIDAEQDILDGTPGQPGLFRLLGNATAERDAARRRVALQYYGK